MSESSRPWHEQAAELLAKGECVGFTRAEADELEPLLRAALEEREEVREKLEAAFAREDRCYENCGAKITNLQSERDALAARVTDLEEQRDELLHQAVANESEYGHGYQAAEREIVAFLRSMDPRMSLYDPSEGECPHYLADQIAAGAYRKERKL